MFMFLDYDYHHYRTQSKQQSDNTQNAEQDTISSFCIAIYAIPFVSYIDYSVQSPTTY